MIRRSIWILLASFFLFGCQPVAEEKEPTLIAISWYYPNNDYQKWLSLYDDELTFFNVYDTEDELIDELLAKSSGFVLTGGCDLDPGLYGKGDAIAQCGKLDPRRDSLEMLMVSMSFESKKPMLGVCRGMQIMSVAAGGELIIDLPTERNTSIHQQEKWDAYHEVRLNQSWLADMTGCEATVVNSNHHQGLASVGQGYEVVAWAPDSTIEGIHWVDTLSHPFALGVQWHPERLERRNPLAGRLARAFLEKVHNYAEAN